MSTIRVFRHQPLLAHSLVFVVVFLHISFIAFLYGFPAWRDSCHGDGTRVFVAMVIVTVGVFVVVMTVGVIVATVEVGNVVVVDRGRERAS